MNASKSSGKACPRIRFAPCGHSQAACLICSKTAKIGNWEIQRNEHLQTTQSHLSLTKVGSFSTLHILSNHFRCRGGVIQPKKSNTPSLTFRRSYRLRFFSDPVYRHAGNTQLASDVGRFFAFVEHCSHFDAVNGLRPTLIHSSFFSGCNAVQLTFLA